MPRRPSIPTLPRVGPIAALASVLIAAATSALAVIAAPGAALATSRAAGATLFVNRPCYVIASRVPSMTVTGSGYAPGSHVLITSTANLDASTTASATGRIKLKLKAPAPHFSAPSVKRFTFTATDASTTARSVVRVAPLGALHGSTPKAPGLKALSEPTNWSFSGFVPGRTIYAHYTIGGQQVARASFGVAQGPCGTLRARAPLYPATPHHASYPVQFDGARRYSPRTQPRITGRVSLNTSF